MKGKVLLQANNEKKFNYAKFRSYKDGRGRRVEYKDINGITGGGLEVTRAITTLDKNDEYDSWLIDWIKGHPFVKKGSFRLIDMEADEEMAMDDILESANAVGVAAKLNTKEAKDFARLTGMNMNSRDDIIKARVIKLASDNPKKFNSIYNNKDKNELIFIKKALERELIVQAGGAYKYNTETIGLSEDQVVLWLKDNKDIYALLKAELRKKK